MFDLIKKFNQSALHFIQTPKSDKEKAASTEEAHKLTALRNEIEDRVKRFTRKNDDIDRQIEKLEKQRRLNNKAIEIGKRAIKTYDDSMKVLNRPSAKPKPPKK